MAIQWRKDLEIGIEEIDSQHKELVERINNLLLACTAGGAREEVGKTLDFLVEYVHTHFKAEEQYQSQVGFPDYENHAKVHQEFLEEVVVLKETFDEQGPTLNFTVTFNKKVVNWLIQHIGRMDKEIAKYIHKG